MIARLLIVGLVATVVAGQTRPADVARGAALVDVEVTVPAGSRRSTTRMNRLEPDDYRGRPLVVRASGE